MTMEVAPSDTESIAQSIIPYLYDDNRARYLGLRSSGFKVREALKLIGITKSALSMWRLDAQFVELERRLPEYRKQLALEYVNLEFLRNFRLLTEKDHQIVQRSLEMLTLPPSEKYPQGRKVSAILLPQEHQYLLKMRTFYTPQQLQAIHTMVTGESPDHEFDFTEIAKAIGRAEMKVKIKATRESVEVSTENALPELQGADEDS